MANIITRPNEDWRDHLETINYDPDPYFERNEFIRRLMFGCLQYHYPGHHWATTSNVRQGVATIKMPSFTDADFILKIDDFIYDPQLKAVVRAGGEFLERFKIPRSGMRYSDYMNQIASDPLGFRSYRNVPV